MTARKIHIMDVPFSLGHVTDGSLYLHEWQALEWVFGEQGRYFIGPRKIGW